MISCAIVCEGRTERLKNLGTNYGKIVHGPRIAKNIGLNVIRSKCPHFNQWLTILEQFTSGLN